MAGSLEMKSNEVKINGGQVAVEYVLLLVVGVGIWIALVSQLVSRNPNQPGPVVRKWVDILKFIGSDDIEVKK